MSKVYGICRVKVNGGTLRSKAEDGAVMRIGGITRDMKASVQGIDFVEKYVHGEIETTLHMVAGTDLEALRTMTNGTVEFVSDVGETWILGQAVTMEIGDLSGGEVTVKFGGKPMTKQ